MTKQEMIEFINQTMANAKTSEVEVLQLSTEEENNLEDSFTKENIYLPLSNLGILLCDKVNKKLQNSSFSRKILANMDTYTLGTFPIKVRRKDISTYIMTDNEKIENIENSRPILYPPTFNTPFTLDIDIKALKSSLYVNSLYTKVLQETLKKEQMLTIALLKQCYKAYNDQILFTQCHNSGIEVMKKQISRWAIPTEYLLLATKSWNSLSQVDNFLDTWIPPTESDVLCGNLGSIWGLKIITDRCCNQKTQVLADHELFVTGTPSALGAFGIEKRLNYRIIDIYKTTGENSIGLSFAYNHGQAVTNSRSITVGNIL